MENNVKSIKSSIVKKSVKFGDEEFEVRDIRDSFYMLDNDYIRIYARVCGIYATGFTI